MQQRIVVLVLPWVNLLDLSGPVQVFTTATYLGAGYRVTYVSPRPTVRSAQGLELASIEELPEVAADDLVLVPGPDLSRSLEISPAVVDWIQGAARAGATIASVCTGAFLLGEAGLLDGRRCTAHWSVIREMRRRYPRARVADDLLYIMDEPIFTSAGIASGIDLALAIVERDHGPTLAARVARELVVYLRRNGTAAPLSPFVEFRDHVVPAVQAVQQMLSDDFARRYTLAELAAAVHVAPRTLTAHFVQAIGMTPLQYQQTLRIGHAKTLLASTDLSVEDISAACGYGDARQLRRAFTQSQGITPRDYRVAIRR
ncbi:GlxA family transcriptional regulator [Mycolicibacterium mageritense]|uniref:Transcriptional regulator n=1 Tax=Mycolicibacterium mageritense TaxID=53462 RepID=A0ABM7HS49_MYCME|nr:GlxA family transcriptional regulator [Mycolicibacterium mageritense]MCC9180090.1 GlxA family transcriptional regulator [Mycolicibacterium mageritense]BBX33383.1 transcriptional regulator [Mycolicibacterium mageritense]